MLLSVVWGIWPGSTQRNLHWCLHKEQKSTLYLKHWLRTDRPMDQRTYQQTDTQLSKTAGAAHLVKIFPALGVQLILIVLLENTEGFLV